MSEIEVIMAIKLGTNYSTNAYMIKHVDPDDRKMLNVPFKTQTTSQMSVTTPTVALFEDNGTICISSYGSEAELQYIHLADRSNHLLFREFIWHLFCADDTIPEDLSDVNGKRMNSVDVLSSVIEYMVSHVKFETGEDVRGIPITFKYVFTIPTCSCEGAKKFMSEAAIKAGCSPNDVIVVEEAAAALQFYMNSQYDGELQALDVSDRCYLVVELEDDNVTISILNHINEERIVIMYRNTAEVWGSCQIQKDIVEMLSCETSETLLDGFFEKYPLEHFELLQEIKKKIKYTLPETSRVVIKMSALMLEKNGSFEDMQKAVLKTGLKDKLNFKLDKCIISPEAFQSLFIDAGKQIVQYLKKELPTDLSDINSIILIGEFAQSPILQNIIMRSFPSINIHVPGEANMAAVKGSVLVGEDNIHVDTSECICGSKVSITENVCPSEGNVQRSSTKESDSKPTKIIQSKKRNQSRLCVIQ